MNANDAKLCEHDMLIRGLLESRRHIGAERDAARREIDRLRKILDEISDLSTDP